MEALLPCSDERDQRAKATYWKQIEVVLKIDTRDGILKFCSGKMSKQVQPMSVSWLGTYGVFPHYDYMSFSLSSNTKNEEKWSNKPYTDEICN